MKYCTKECKARGWLCTCNGIPFDAGQADRHIFLHYEREHVKMNRYIKILLLVGALYFLGHIGYALAQTAPQPYPQPIIRCIPGGGGTVTCFPL